MILPWPILDNHTRTLLIFLGPVWYTFPSLPIKFDQTTQGLANNSPICVSSISIPFIIHIPFKCHTIILFYISISFPFLFQFYSISILYTIDSSTSWFYSIDSTYILYTIKNLFPNASTLSKASLRFLKRKMSESTRLISAQRITFATQLVARHLQLLIWVFTCDIYICVYKR